VPKYWLISDRDRGPGGIGTGTDMNNAGLTYWVSDTSPLNNIGNWQKVPSKDAFTKLLAAAADQFQELPPDQQQSQQHVTLLIHGYNVSFDHAATFYEYICSKLFSGPDSLGICVHYDWPSWGNVLGYYPDREHARQCAGDLTGVLSDLYDWLLKNQQAAVNAVYQAYEKPDKQPKEQPCKAKVSVIAHSMGNYVLQKAMAHAWTRRNQPLLASLINQLLMVAADVDNNLFDAGAPDNDDGEAMANLTYRVTALYSGRDAALGVSAGLKHFGARRLGRAGLSHRPPLVAVQPETDNVWDVDCSSFFPETGFSIPGIGSVEIHGAYFDDNYGTWDLMRLVLRGVDRGVLNSTGATEGNKWP
jgi:esterase/lipase superfamily enzyme